MGLADFDSIEDVRLNSADDTALILTQQQMMSGVAPASM